MNNASVRAPMTAEVFHMLQAQAARENVTINILVRKIIYAYLKVSETEIDLKDSPRYRLTPTKRRLLTILETGQATGGFSTTPDLASASEVSYQSVYIALRDLTREGMILRGPNVRTNAAAGAPCKAWMISELGLKVLSDERKAVENAHSALQQSTTDSFRTAMQGYLSASVEPLRKQADQDTYQKPLHGALRYIAMARLGRTMDSEADLAWVASEAKRLCTLADTDVAQGKATFEAHHKAIMAKVDALGGFQAISEKFNIG